MGLACLIDSGRLHWEGYRQGLRRPGCASRKLEAASSISQQNCMYVLLSQVKAIDHTHKPALCSSQGLTRVSKHRDSRYVTDIKHADVCGLLAALQMVQLCLLARPPGPHTPLAVPALPCLLPLSSPTAQGQTRMRFTAVAAMLWQRRLQWQHCRGGCCQLAWRVCRCLALLGWRPTVSRASQATSHA